MTSAESQKVVLPLSDETSMLFPWNHLPKTNYDNTSLKLAHFRNNMITSIIRADSN